VALEVVSPRIRGFICTNAHPAGCAASVAHQVDVAKKARPAGAAGGNALIVGASTGYGLASRIAAAFTHDMATAGVFLEREPSDRKTATAGWYNSAAFHAQAAAAGRKAVSVNGDAFSNAVRAETLERIRREMGPIDLFIYSLASPVRMHPDTGTQLRSTLKPVGASYVTKTLDLDRETVGEVTLEPASQAEIDATVAVMGGDDLLRWTRALSEAGLLSKTARVVAYSYVGPKLTWPIYRDGTIGQAKTDLLRACRGIHAELNKTGGGAWISINSAVVTQASSAIPAVPLYLSLLRQVMVRKGVWEEIIVEVVRLLGDHLAPGRTPRVDSEGRIRVDDLEMAADIQAEVQRLWDESTSENVHRLGDVAGMKRDFQQLFGFSIDGVDYAAPVEIDVPMGDAAGV
jgi:enoyl-[acyl-carrier protein] reductase/trans-2-enoyl-CoA reductase (NAD+)